MMINEILGGIALISIIVVAISGAIWIVRDYNKTKTTTKHGD